MRERLLLAGRWFVLLCLFSVPISKPATNIFIFLALLCALFGTGARERFRAAARHPVAVGAIAWFLYLLLDASLRSSPEGWQALGVYKVLLYPLIVMSLIDTRQWRERAFLAFGASTGLVLLLSVSLYFLALVSRNQNLLTEITSFTIFKNYTQQGIALLVMASLAAAFARTEANRRRRIALWAIALIALFDVIFVLQSRTAYLIAAPLVIYWVWQLAGIGSGGWRRTLLAILLLGLLGVAALSAPRVQQRLQQAEREIELYSQKNMATSLGIRIELWRHTLPVVRSAPWFGHGLGQWQAQFKAEVEKFEDFNPHFIMGHPHQEALLILSEQGVAGFAVLAALLLLLLFYAHRLEPPYRDIYTCLVLIYVTSGLANCVLADFSHRHVFLMLLALIPLAAPRLPSRSGVTQ
jgi:O-antigen ligase